MNAPSPLWYRMRGAIFGAIYLVGFYGGSYVWSLGGNRFAPAYAWAGARLGPSGPSLLLAAATLCVFICWALRAWGSAYLSYGVVWNLNARTDALLVDGPFRYVRNPLYLGNLFLALGIGSLATPFGFVVIVLGSLGFVAMLVTEENRALRNAYGTTFDAYRRAVPSLIPRLTPANVAGSVEGRASLAQGLRSEIMTGALCIGMLLVLAWGESMFVPMLVLWFAGWMVQAAATRPPAAQKRS